MNALLSVSDKTGIVEFAKELHALGIKLLSTGGTAKLLADKGLPVTEVAEVTQFPEMLDGRVKTLHPKVHGGLLARRELPEHMAALKEHGIDTIDLLVVNLYPFEATVAKAGCTLADAIENIDIGGPAMVRSAAKNWKDVGVITSADQYEAVLAELKAGGKLSDKLRFALSVAAFNRIAQYDGAISDYLSSVSFEAEKLSEAYVPQRTLFPGQSNGIFTKVQDLRYGENSHQQAALYRDLYPAPGSLVTGVQLQGKELSYNNIADADAAWECVKSFDVPACVIVKHANPCGVAVGKDAHEAYSQGLPDRPDQRLRRHHRLQPHGGQGGGRSRGQAVRRGADGPRLHARGAGDLQAQGQCAPDEDRPAGRRRVRLGPGPQRHGRQARGLGPAAADGRQPRAGAGRPEGGDQEAAHARRTERPAVRLEGGQVRQEQRHRVLQERHDHGRGRGPDEPPGFGAHRQHQGRGTPS
jgi:hypothetical protein